MPSRKSGIVSKVLKSTKSRKSLSPGEKEQIQDFVKNSQSSQDTNNYFANQNDPDTPVPVSSCNTSFNDIPDATGANLQNGGPIRGDPHAGPLPHGLNPGAAYALSAMNTTQPLAQPVIYQQPQQQQPQASATRTAGEVAFEIYGEEVKIEGGLCGKLAMQPAQREPQQRRNDQKLNLERRGNVEALLAHTAGEQAPRPCKNCHKGHGPFTTCVVYDGQMCGSCANCWFNASGSRCTFQENYHYYPPPMLAPPVVSSQAPVAAASGAAASVASSIPSFSGPISATPVPIAPALAPGPARVPASPACQPAAVNDSFVSQGSVQHPSPVEHPLPGLSDQPFISEQAGRLINDAFERTRRYSTMQRMQARIDAAAQALGMAIMDYENYVNSVQERDKTTLSDYEYMQFLDQQDVDGTLDEYLAGYPPPFDDRSSSSSHTARFE